MTIGLFSSAEAVLAELRRRGLEVRAAGPDRLMVRPSGAVDKALAEALRTHKTELIRLLSGASGPAPEARCAACGATLRPEEIPAGVCEGCAQAVVVAPTGPDPEALGRAEGAVGTAPEPEAGFRVKPGRCPTCGGDRFYQPWTGPQAGHWFCIACNPGLKPETEPFITGREELRDLAHGVYKLAKKLDFPELELYPGRRVGPGREAWVEAVRRPLEAGCASRLWALLYTLEEAVSPEEEKAYADKVLALAQDLGYPEMEADNRCPGPIRRIPAGAVSWAVAVVTMDPAGRRYWLKRLQAGEGRGGPGA